MKRLIQFGQLIKLYSLSGFLGAAQQQISLYDASLSLQTLEVSQRTSGTLTMTRVDGTDEGLWQENMCFELIVDSPYEDTTSYQPFIRSEQPECVNPRKPGVNVDCQIKSSDSTTLQFWFTNIPQQNERDQVFQMTFTNFHTPWSGQTLKNIKVRYYSDYECIRSQRQKKLPAITIQPATIPNSNIRILSSSDTLGYTGRDNVLQVSFKPVTTMAKKGKGVIEIQVPNWYKVGTSKDFMYSNLAEDQCTSTCMEVIQSRSMFGTIRLFYEDMTPECITGETIIIECRDFRNPIYQKKWNGFYVITYDDEASPKPIERSQSAFLDAQDYRATTIVPENMRIQPANLEIATASQWTIYLAVPIPMELGCFIKFYFPDDLVYDPVSITAQGFFKPPVGDQLRQDDFVLNLNDYPSPSLLFEGCNDFNGVGEEPYGRIIVNTMTTPPMIKQTGEFFVEIFKDYDLTQRIAHQTVGGVVDPEDLQPGYIDQLTLEPTNLIVGAVSSTRIVFTTAHPISDNGMIQITFPELMSLPAVGSTVKITPNYGSINAVVGIVRPGNVIDIINAFGETNNVSVAAGHVVDIYIEGTINQPSATDAGGFEVTTWTNFCEANGNECNFYLVDQGESAVSFTAIPGSIQATIPTAVSDPITNYQDATWTFAMTTANSIPQGGQIRIDLPADVSLIGSSAISGGSCRVYSCSESNTGVDYIILTIPSSGEFSNGVEAGQDIMIDLVGVINPRTTEPTGTFHISTFDNNGIPIDEGYDVNTQMYFLGQLHSFSAIQTNFVNGVENRYIFSMQSAVPLNSGDKLSFTFPSDIVPPSTSEELNCEIIFGFEEIECNISGYSMEIKFISLANPTGTFQWSAENIRNPISTKPSASFSNIIITDERLYMVCQYSLETPPVTNKYTAQIEEFNLLQGNTRVAEITTYTIEFWPINPMPASGSIQVQWPSTINLIPDRFSCQIRTNRLFTDSDMCQVDLEARIVTIIDVFSEIQGGWANGISIELNGMQNPVNNTPGNGFVIQTYEDDNQIYTMDKLDALRMQPTLECPDPFQRLKSRVDEKQYDGLCHVVLELETYMLDQQGLPIDFVGIGGPEPTSQDKRVFGFGDLTDGLQGNLLGAIYKNGEGSDDFQIEIQRRLDRMELKQSVALAELNKAVVAQEDKLSKVIADMNLQIASKTNEITKLLEQINEKL